MSSSLDSVSVIEELKKEIIFKDWKINLFLRKDLIYIYIQLRNNINQSYYSSFKIKHFKSFKLFDSANSIYDLFNFIIKSIDDKKIRLFKEENNLKFILLSHKCSNVELILDKIEELNEGLNISIENENNLKKEEKTIDCDNNKENKKNDLLKIPNINEIINKINEKIELLEKENKMIIDENKKLKEKNDEINERIKQLELFHNYYYKNKNEIQITKCDNIEIIKKSKEHKNHVNALATFPSGNLISVSKDSTIKIYDENLNVLETIEDNDNDGLIYVEVKNEDNFITCGYGNIIKIYFRGKNNKFTNNYKVIKDNKSFIDNYNIFKYNNIRKVIYGLNGHIISCSIDNTIKIWEKNNYNQFDKIKTLYHNQVNSILLLEDKKMLVSCGIDKTKFWNLNDYSLNFEINAYCAFHAGLNRIDEDRIICGGKKGECILKIISISNKEIIHKIDNKKIECYTILTIKNKGIFLSGDNNSMIKVYRYDVKNYENLLCINANQGIINSIILLNDGTIGVCSNDKTIQIMSIEFSKGKQKETIFSLFSSIIK